MFPEGRALEFLIAGVIALIVVGPKDLPVLMRKLGQFTGKLRAMAAEFRASFDEMARQSELDELRKEVEAMRSAQVADVAAHAAGVREAFTDIHQNLADVSADLHPATPPPSYSEAPSTPLPDAAPEPEAKPKPRARRATPASPAAKTARKPAAARPRTRKAPPEPEA
jgi:sec-independent protein translocase protein TatB